METLFIPHEHDFNRWLEEFLGEVFVEKLIYNLVLPMQNRETFSLVFLKNIK